jgi:hypothetical protein
MGAEILAMRDIKARLFKTRPETRGRLLPAYFKEVFDIAPAPRLTETFDRIRARRSIGSQYEWLARFCEEVGVNDMELGIHKDGNVQKLLEPFCIKSADEGGLRYRVDPALEGSDKYALFKYFRFPILDLTKIEMQAIARTSGFYDLMELTWFCHSPRPGFRPCGVCNPCIYTMEEGLGRRIPFTSRVRFHLRAVSRLKHFVRKRPSLYLMAKKLRRSLRKAS